MAHDGNHSGETSATRPTLAMSIPSSGETFVMVSSSRTGDGLFRFRWTLAPGRRGPPPHMHPHETETFAIVAGTLRVWIAGVQRDLHPGDSLAIPPGVPHRFLNPGPEPLVANVSLNGPLQEDTFIPYAVMQTNGESVTGLAWAKNAITQFARGAIGAHPAWAQVLLRAVARALVTLGMRNLPPIADWDSPHATLAELRARLPKQGKRGSRRPAL
jgi:mannose-6-phosphate isomerase-like protein (cupin superfamily)